MIFQPAVGNMWDPSVLWHGGRYYAFYMYQHPGSAHWGDSVGLATSEDGVHWREEEPVLELAFRKHQQVYKMFIARCGDRFIMNHGAFSGKPGTGNDTLCFWESRDLRQWTYLYETTPDPHWYCTAERWDHMYMLPKEEGNPGAGYWGYVVAIPRPELVKTGHACGMMESPDGRVWLPMKPAQFEWEEISPLAYLETGGCERIGGRYYLIGGGFRYMGNVDYSMYTFVAEEPRGPFRPDVEAFRLCGSSGHPDFPADTYPGVQWLAAWARGDGELLISNYISPDPARRIVPWMLPLRKAIVDAQGHLRLGYWQGNDAARGQAIEVPSAITISPDGAYTVKMLEMGFVPETGLILEGTLRIGQPGRAGLYLEETPGSGCAMLLEAGDAKMRRTEIGTLDLAAQSFRTLDVTGSGCATVTGLEVGKRHRFRLWARQNMFEVYVDDLLVQSYFTRGMTGRVGVVAEGAKVEIRELRGWAMSFCF